MVSCDANSIMSTEIHYKLYENTILVLVPFGHCGAKPDILRFKENFKNTAECLNASGVDLMYYQFGEEKIPPVA